MAAEVARRDAVPSAQLTRRGIAVPEVLPAGVHRCGALLVAEAALSAWSTRLRDAVTAEHDQHPLSAGLPRKAALDLLDAPGEALPELLERADLVERDGRVLDPLRSAQLGPAETAIAALEQHLGEEPFASPSADHLTALGLGPEELAAAARLGRVLRLPGDPHRSLYTAARAGAAQHPSLLAFRSALLEAAESLTALEDLETLGT